MVTLCFYKPFSLQGRLVGLWTRSQWVHVSIEHRIGDLDIVTEATMTRGVVVRRSDYARPADVLIRLPWMPEEATTNYLSRYWGSAYGLRDVLGFLAPTRHNFGGVHCAELVALMLSTAIPFIDGEPDGTYEPLKSLVASSIPHRVSPADLAHALGLFD